MGDAIRFECPSCSATYRVPAAQGGRKAACTKCGAKFLIPQTISSLVGASRDAAGTVRLTAANITRALAKKSGDPVKDVAAGNAGVIEPTKVAELPPTAQALADDADIEIDVDPDANAEPGGWTSDPSPTEDAAATAKPDAATPDAAPVASSFSSAPSVAAAATAKRIASAGGTSESGAKRGWNIGAFLAGATLIGCLFLPWAVTPAAEGGTGDPITPLALLTQPDVGGTLGVGASTAMPAMLKLGLLLPALAGLIFLLAEIALRKKPPMIARVLATLLALAAVPLVVVGISGGDWSTIQPDSLAAVVNEAGSMQAGLSAMRPYLGLGVALWFGGCVIALITLVSGALATPKEDA